MKQTKAAPSPFTDFESNFQFMLSNPALAFQAFDLFPLPIEVFAPDGTTVFANRAGLEWLGIADKSLLIGKYNTLKDPVMEQMGVKDVIQKAFQGNASVAYDVNIPVQDLVDRGVIEEKPFEKSFTDWHFCPVKDGKKLAFVIFVCVIKKIYLGSPYVAHAKEYIDTHWKEEFNSKALALSVNMSKTPLYDQFKKETGLTPGDYYRKCKVEHIKEKLADDSLSIKEAFAECGEDSKGSFLKAFKKHTGFSPREFRENLKNK